MSDEQRTPNWTVIRQEYEDGASLRALAVKHRISKSVIGERKFKEKWDQTKRTPTRTASNTQTVIQPDMNAAVRAALGFRLRFEQHKTWEEVAAGAGYASRGAARNAVKREAERRITHDISEIRQEELYRINRLQERCYTAAMDEGYRGWTFAVQRWTDLSKRKSELMGLDVKSDEAASNVVVVREIPSGYLSDEGKSE